jgi:predicted small secreted protein
MIIPHPRLRHSWRRDQPGAIHMLTRLLAVLMLAGFITGCNTMEGAGKDLERGGEKIQEKAKG